MNTHPFRVLAAAVLVLVLMVISNPSRAGVTFITHGLNGNTDGWVSGMADQIPHYPGFLGTNFSCYKAYFFLNSGTYYLTAMRVSGSAPTSPESGEVIVKFDWSQIADGDSYNTYQVANIAAMALLSTNFISELGGHALAEFPLHLIGHSRGGSLACELSRVLGTNGVWVDHLTTLDPHPLNNDGFNLDWILYSAVDAPAKTYASVLFHDNYWQDSSWPVYGETVSGSYTRQLTSFSGGYSSEHSDVHLWYHGTIDFRVPASDTEASINSTQRTNWWNAYETQGTRAGFLYSLIGGGNRLSTDRPQGASYPMINSGYNQSWDFGAGQSANRTALTTNNGSWPSLVKFNRTSTNPVTQGMSANVKFFYQWVGSATNGTIGIYLDEDFNPLNNNQVLLKQIAASGTGAPGFVGAGAISVLLAADNAPIGWHALLAAIQANGKTRYLYAPELIQIIGAPKLDIAWLDSTQFRIGINGVQGQTVILQTSTNLIDWRSISTNLLTADRLAITNATGAAERFYRSIVVNQ